MLTACPLRAVGSVAGRIRLSHGRTREYSETSWSGDGHTWVVSIQCGNGGICTEHVECTEGGQEGYVHDVYMDGTDVVTSACRRTRSSRSTWRS